MNVINFTSSTSTQYKIAILIKETSFNRQSLETYYVNDLSLKGVDISEIMAVDLAYEAGN